MFNKKFAVGLCNLLAFMLIAKTLLVTVMFVWGFFGEAPVQVFDARVEGIVKYLLFLQEIGSTIFVYVLVVSMQYFISGHAKAKMASPMIAAPVAARPHVVAKKRPTTKSNV